MMVDRKRRLQYSCPNLSIIVNLQEILTMATIQVRVDDSTKAAADSLFASLGLDTSTAVRMFIAAAVDSRGIPFDVKKTRKPIEINDGSGSYICEYGHFHDYSRLKPKLDEAIKETVGPFNSVGDLMKSLDDE